MGDRFTPPSDAVTVSTSERETPLAYLSRRLRKLGATDDELSSLADEWAKGDDDGWVMPRHDLAHAPDTVLVALLAEVRAEYHVSTTTEDEDAARAAQAERAHLHEQAWAVVTESTVPEVMAWVGDDLARAVAARDSEQMRAQPRSTLLGRLGLLIDEAQADG